MMVFKDMKQGEIPFCGEGRENEQKREKFKKSQHISTFRDWEDKEHSKEVSRKLKGKLGNCDLEVK